MTEKTIYHNGNNIGIVYSISFGANVTYWNYRHTVSGCFGAGYDTCKSATTALIVEAVHRAVKVNDSEEKRA